MKACSELGIGQKITRISCPQSNGKAERVIRAIMEMWHQRETFRGRKSRQISLIVIMVTLAVGLAAVVTAFVRDYSGKMTKADRARWDEFKRLLTPKTRT